MNKASNKKIHDNLRRSERNTRKSDSACIDREALKEKVILEEGNFSEKVLKTIADLEKKIHENYQHFEAVINHERSQRKIETENQTKLIENLQRQLFKQEAKLYNSDLCVKGIPESNGENIEYVMNNVFQFYGFHNFTNYRAFRMGKRNNKFFRTIVVKFGNFLDKEDFYNKYLNKCGLNCSEIGFPISSRVFINEYLSPMIYREFVNAIGLRKNGTFHKVFAKCNCFFVQQFENGPSLKFSTPHEYELFVKTIIKDQYVSSHENIFEQSNEVDCILTSNLNSNNIIQPSSSINIESQSIHQSEIQSKKAKEKSQFRKLSSSVVDSFTASLKPKKSNFKSTPELSSKNNSSSRKSTILNPVSSQK